MALDRFDFLNAGGQRLAAVLDSPPGEPAAFALFAHCFTCGKDNLAASRIAHALAIVALSVSASQGLERNWWVSAAALRIISLSECPERMMRTISGCIFFTRSNNWHPSIPGIRMSVTITSKVFSHRISRASCPLTVNSISHCERMVRSILCKPSSTLGSSSTKSILFFILFSDFKLVILLRK